MTMLRFMLFSVLAFALPAQAEMYKYVDEKGHVTYSNKPIKGGKPVELPEISTMPAPKPLAKSEKPTQPDDATERARERQDLEAQISRAEKAVAEAKQAYQEGSEKPEVWQRTKTVVGKDGKPTTVTERGRNVAAYESKMKALQDNLDAKQKELDDLRAQLKALNPQIKQLDNKR